MHSMTVDYDNADCEICLVCGGPTRGLHFQVNACRACAAFYRRSVKSKLVYRCQRGTGRCDLKTKINGKPLCRYCRMKKCAEIGMRLDATDIGHESTTSSPLDKAPYSVPHIEHQFSGSVVRVEGKRVIYDANPLIHTIKENLKKDTTNSFYGIAGVKLSPLQRMAYEIATFISHYTPNIADVEVISEIVSNGSMRFQEEYLLKLVHICTSCEHFVKLEHSQKFLMFRHFWGAFQNIERAYQTMMLFGHEVTDTRFLIEYNKAMDIGRTKLLAYGDVDNEELKRVFEPVKERMFCYLLNPMKALRPTLFEISYIALNCLWCCVDLTDITSDTYQTSEEVLQRSANELHNYYTYDMKLPNYAARHAALIRLISTTEALRRSRKDAFILAKFFNVIQFDFFECELEE
uniref:Nuclear receptor domain-containing protein n=1 Tax=Panagrellus redivivus TaxID=6233 RepID=A0A7E4UX47_PANRE